MNIDIEKIENLLVKNEMELVLRELNSIEAKKLPRRLVLKLTNIARRAGAPNLALKFSNRIIRPLTKLDQPATTEEIAEYAVALSDIGSVKEALALLRKLDSTDNPKILLNTAYCLFSIWDYSMSIDYLTRFLESSKLSPYDSLIGKVNLAAAYIMCEEYENASNLLDDVRSICHQEGYQLLYGNAWELTAQLYFYQGKLDLAEEAIECSLKALPDQQSIYQFMARKWQKLIQLARSPNEIHLRNELKGLEDEARNLSHWESIRDIQFHRCRILNDEEGFWRVYFGTAHKNFRKRMIHLFNPSFIKEQYILHYGNFDEKKDRIFDVRLAREAQGPELKPNMLIHRLFILFSSDRYREFQMGEIFHFLFEDEFFDPFSSPDRVHQVVKRFRQWLKESDIPVEIRFLGRGYKAYIGDQYGVCIDNNLLNNEYSRAIGYLARLLSIGVYHFTTREAAQLLGLSKSAVNKWLVEAIEENLVEKSGQGKNTKYDIIQVKEEKSIAS